MKIKLFYVVDGKDKKKAVQIGIDDWTKLMNQLEKEVTVKEDARAGKTSKKDKVKKK